MNKLIKLYDVCVVKDLAMKKIQNFIIAKKYTPPVIEYDNSDDIEYCKCPMCNLCLFEMDVLDANNYKK